MEAVKDEVKKEGDDASMEEILQSIRKIIADDDKGVTAPANGTAKGAEQAIAGSEVLELTVTLRLERRTKSCQVERAHLRREQFEVNGPRNAVREGRRIERDRLIQFDALTDHLGIEAA